MWPLPQNGKVVFGVTVSLLNVDTDKHVVYQIVGEDEADIKVNKISVGSPIARALIGKEEGETVVVKTPVAMWSMKLKRFGIFKAPGSSR